MKTFQAALLAKNFNAAHTIAILKVDQAAHIGMDTDHYRSHFIKATTVLFYHHYSFILQQNGLRKHHLLFI